MFLALTAGIVIFFGDTLTKTSRFNVDFTGCEVAVSKPLETRKDYNVVLSVASDKDAEFHLHGYDIERDLVAGKREAITFRTVEIGKFGVGLHDDCDANTAHLTVLNPDGTIPTEKIEQQEVEEAERRKPSETKPAETTTETDHADEDSEHQD